MKIPSGTTSRPHRLTCPLCERGLLYLLGTGFARCSYCGMPLIGSALETLREVVALPDSLGSHPCECGHPEMRSRGVNPKIGEQIRPAQRVFRAPLRWPQPWQPLSSELQSWGHATQC
jgi:hypothetical protein